MAAAGRGPSEATAAVPPARHATIGGPQPRLEVVGAVTVCFDADGTLYYSQTTAAEVWRQFCAVHGVVVTIDATAAALERVSAQFHPRWTRLRPLKQACPDRAADIEEAFWADFNAQVLACWGLERHSGEVRRWFNETDLDATVLYPDTIPALRALAAAGVVMGVYSNRPTPIQPTITRLGMARYFRWVGSAGDTGFSKPDPRAFTTAAAALGVGPPALVYVGDSVVADIQGARSAGCRPVLLDRLGKYGGEIGCPVVGSLLDLLDQLEF